MEEMERFLEVLSFSRLNHVFCILRKPMSRCKMQHIENCVFKVRKSQPRFSHSTNIEHHISCKKELAFRFCKVKYRTFSTSWNKHINIIFVGKNVENSIFNWLKLSSLISHVKYTEFQAFVCHINAQILLCEI